MVRSIVVSPFETCIVDLRFMEVSKIIKFDDKCLKLIKGADETKRQRPRNS